MLISVGSSGTIRPSIAQELARKLGAVYLEIESIEHAMRNEGWPVDGEGRGVAQVVAYDNLRLGRTVVVYSSNPWPPTSNEWRLLAAKVGVPTLNVVLMSDQSHGYERGTRAAAQLTGSFSGEGDGIVIHTARLTLDESVQEIIAKVPRSFPGGIASIRVSVND